MNWVKLQIKAYISLLNLFDCVWEYFKSCFWKVDPLWES